MTDSHYLASLHASEWALRAIDEEAIDPDLWISDYPIPPVEEPMLPAVNLSEVFDAAQTLVTPPPVTAAAAASAAATSTITELERIAML